MVTLQRATEMPQFLYQTPEMENPIFINKDDFQVCSSIMEGMARVKNGLAEMEKRGMIEAVAAIRPFNKDYLETFKNDPAKLASFCYEQLMEAMTSPVVERL